MEPLHVREKPAGQHTDFAAGERDSVISCKRAADLLPLPVADKALQPDVGHDVVTDDAARRDESHERPGLFASRAAANAHRLPQPERAVDERHAGTFPCLSDPGRIAADGAPLWGFLLVDECTGNALRADAGTVPATAGSPASGLRSRPA